MEQCFIQVRVDEKLKKEATDVLEQIGLDMPNAIRMFLKRIVMEKGLPFEAKIPEMAEAMANTQRNQIKKECRIEYIPETPYKLVDYSEYIEALKKVPFGKITRDDDIYEYLAKKHNVNRVELSGHRPLQDAFDKKYPYWRVVSTRGFLCEDRFLYSVGEQKRLLEAEGLKIIQAGAGGKSLKVENYKNYLYDFNC